MDSMFYICSASPPTILWGRQLNHMVTWLALSRYFNLFIPRPSCQLSQRRDCDCSLTHKGLRHVDKILFTLAHACRCDPMVTSRPRYQMIGGDQLLINITDYTIVHCEVVWSKISCSLSVYEVEIADFIIFPGIRQSCQVVHVAVWRHVLCNLTTTRKGDLKKVLASERLVTLSYDRNRINHPKFPTSKHMSLHTACGATLWCVCLFLLLV